jgi:hypothetical protein
MKCSVFCHSLLSLGLWLILSEGVASGQANRIADSHLSSFGRAAGQAVRSDQPGRFSAMLNSSSESGVGLPGGERLQPEIGGRVGQGEWMQNNSARQLASREPYVLSGRFYLQQGTNSGYLILQCDLPSGSYINSITLPKEHYPSEIQIVRSRDYSIQGPFQADRAPTVILQDPLLGHRTEKHFGTIQFFVPIHFAAGVDLTDYQLNMTFNGQVCTDSGSCLPVRKKSVAAKFAGYFQAPVAGHPGEK